MSLSSLADIVTNCELDGGRLATLRELGREDFLGVMALRADVISRLPDPDLYVREENESAFVLSQLGKSSMCLGIEADAKLIAYTVLTLDIEDADVEPELGRAIRERATVAGEPLRHWGLFAVTMVHPDFRGQGLHDLAIERRFAVARVCGKRVLIAMVPTINVPSLHNLMRKGYRIDGVLDFADGRVRFLLSCALTSDTRVEPEQAAGEIPLHEIDTHRRLIDGGFIGRELVFRRKQPYLKFVQHPRCWDRP